VSAAYTLAANAPTQQFINIPLTPPPGGTSPPAADGTDAGGPYTYNANDGSVGDVDGDGEYEIILKWDPSNSKDNSQSGFTGDTYLDCYKLDGTRLWRIDLGPNIRSGAHYMDFMVYDFDGDGKAEIMCRTAPGSKDGLGSYVGGVAKWQNANGPHPTFNDTDDYRNTGPNGVNGYVLAGPEFLTVFNGQTGAEMATATFYPKRDQDNNDDNPTSTRINTIWGDGYGNRIDRFLAGIAFLDGQRPSAIFCRGYYTRAFLTAWDWRNGVLIKRWVFDSNDGTPGNTAYRGQGAHSLSIGDADGDGRDDIVYGAASIDSYGKALYSTGLGHGDAEHYTDMDPWRPGKEIWMVHEDPGSYGPTGLEYRDAKTGALIFGVDGQGADVGRGVAYDIDPRYRGYEMWGARGGLMSATGVQISSTHPSQENFCVWWDSDVLRETLDGTTIYKWDWNSSVNNSILSPSGISSDNGTKSTPCLSADIFGDWREEVIWRTSDNLNLRIYTTTTPATNRIYTLMHDPQYRCAIAWQNTGYNQPPHPGFFIGADMFTPPLAPDSLAKLLWRGGAGNVWDTGTSANWFTNNVWSNSTPATVFNTGDSVLFDLSSSNNSPINIAAPIAPGDVTVYSYKDYTFTGESLTGAMTLKKAGNAALALNNNNSYTGGTFVSDGALRVNGNLSTSPVFARWPGVVGGHGALGGGLTLQRGGGVEPGAIANAAGLLTISNTLTELGEAANRFDLSDDPTGATKTNDQIQVFGNVSLSGTNTVEINPLNGKLGFGAYNLITYSGALSGGVGNLSASGLNGEFFFLTNSPGAISLVLPAHRAATNLLWVGSGANNWDLGATADWTDGSGVQQFFPDDVVRFDNTGSTSPSVNLLGSLRPGSIVVDSANNYTFAGSGAFIGVGGLTKTNSGTLTISATANSYTGPTILAGGIVAIPAIANGGSPSPIGAADNAPGNTVFSGGTLRYTGITASTDRGMTFNSGGGTLDINSGSATLTLIGSLTGSGPLTKTGAGILNISAANPSFTGNTTIRQGTLSFGAAVADTSGLGTGSVTLTNGATLNFFASTSGDTPAGGPFVNAIIIPTNTSGSIFLPFRISFSSAVTGGGTLNIRVNGVRDEIFGNWSGFYGQLNVTSQSGVSDFRCNNSAGYPNAKINLAASCTLYNRVSGTPTIPIGELSGSSGSALPATGGSNGLGVNWSIGGLNTSSTFAGSISNNVGIIKVGTGTLTLSAANSYSGQTTVNGGTLLINGNSSAASGAVTVGASGTLGGTGTIGGATTVNGTLSPGANGIGTLTFSSSLTLNSGSTTLLQVQKSTGTKDLANVTGTLTYAGMLTVTNLAGTLVSGDSFKIFNAATYVGAFTTFNLPTPPSGFTWITTNLPINGTLSISGSNGVVVGPQGLTWRGDGGANAWDVGATANWRTVSNTAVTFNQNDSVTFDNAGSNNVPIALNGSLQPAVVNFTATKNYTFSSTGSIDGTNALLKSGAGTLTITTTNTFSGGTMLSGGMVALSGPAAGSVTANNFALGSGPITFNGGTLQLYGYNLGDNNSGFGTMANDLIIPSGQSGTILSGPRYTFGSKVTGNGTLNLNVDYVRDDIAGNWTNFTGTLNVRSTAGTPPSSTSDDFRVATALGFPNARLALSTNVFMYSRATAGSVIPVGEFSADTNTSVSAGSGSGAGAQNAVTWRVGRLNTDTTNAAAFIGTTALIKEGSGRWILTGASTHTGATTVSNGTLLVDGSFTGSPVTVWGGTLGGNGGIGSAVSIRSGATLSPGESIGMFTISNTLTLFPGATTLIELSKLPTANDVLKTTGPLTFGGDLVVVNISSHNFLAGDSFKIFDAASFAGYFNNVTLPDLSTGLEWDINNLYTSGTIAVMSLTPLHAWGDNSFGQSAARLDATNATAIAAGGYHSVALLKNGSVIAWGNNVSGQCDVPGNATGVVAIGAGGSHTLAALADGTVLAWGANDSGQTSVPANATNVVALAAGDSHSLALRGDGTIVAWGDNSWGQATVPTDATNIVAIAAGAQHSLALKADGTVLAWGGNLGPFGTYAGQTDVPWNLNQATAIAAGGFHSLAAQNDGTVLGWGDNSAAQISVPPNLTNAVALAAGYAHSLALGADGAVNAWGDNLYGQSSPPSLGGVMAIAAGSYHSLALQGPLPAAPQLLNATRTGNTFAVSTPTIRGKASILLYKNSLSESNWKFLKAAAGDGSQKSLTDPAANAPQRFYRAWIP
jgi:autotransporter-associated beta strand protein